MKSFSPLSDDIRPIFVIGSLVVACSARVPRCPGPGESLRATGFIMEAGGKGFNVAMAAHRLGVPVDGLFAVGDDAPGSFMRAAFVEAGLSPDLLLTVDGATGAGVGLIEANGENRIAVFPGANDQLSGKAVDAAGERVRGASLVVAQYESPDEPIAAAFAIARAAGVPTLLNPSPYRSISREILAATDILVVNEGEARAVLADLAPGTVDTSHAELARMLSGLGVATLVVTRGSEGVISWQDGRLLEERAFPVEAVDSIGAGDAFTGGLIAALAAKRGLATGLRWGCAAGAMTVARLGLVGALPGLTELAAFLDSGVIPV